MFFKTYIVFEKKWTLLIELKIIIHSGTNSSYSIINANEEKLINSLILEFLLYYAWISSVRKHLDYNLDVIKLNYRIYRKSLGILYNTKKIVTVD